jgi:hypothetical protein
LAEAILRYESYLELAAEFLVNRYGIGEETANAMHLGVVADPFPHHRDMSMRLCIPYFDANNAPRAVKFRCLCHDCKAGGHPKYLGEAGRDPLLYLVKNLVDDKATTLYVAEGEFDAAVLHYELGLCAIGYPGTGSWSDLFTRAVGPDFDRVIVVADHDTAEHQAGQKSAAKVARALKGEVLLMPPGEDVSSWYVKKGRSGLLEVLGIEETTEPM